MSAEAANSDNIHLVVLWGRLEESGDAEEIFVEADGLRTPAGRVGKSDLAGGWHVLKVNCGGARAAIDLGR